MAVDSLLYNRSTSADIGNTSVISKLDTQDRPFVSAVLFNATADASYVVESASTDDADDNNWHTLSDQDTTQSFRFQGTAPEPWVRMRVDVAAGNVNTSVVGIHATK